jgi:hypothetical protein
MTIHKLFNDRESLRPVHCERQEKKIPRHGPATKKISRVCPKKFPKFFLQIFTQKDEKPQV